MADLNLTVQLLPEVKTNQIQTAIENAVSGIKPVPIKIDLDPVVFKDLKSLKAEIEGITRSTQGNFLSWKSIKGDSDAISSIKTQITELANAMQSFKGLNTGINLGNNGVNRMAQYGTSARQTISALQEQANAIEQVIQENYKMADSYSAVMKATSGTKFSAKMLDIFNKINDPSLSLKDQMSAWREYIATMQQVSSIKGIDLTSATSQFSKTADELVKDTERIASGEQELENTTDQLRNIFGSGLGAEQMQEHLNQIIEAIREVTNAIRELNTVAIDTSDVMDGAFGGGKTSTKMMSEAQQIKALTKAEQLRGSIYGQLNSWTQAKNGAASGSYAELEAQAKAVESLISNINSGMTSKSFTDEFNRIKLSAAEAAAEIKKVAEASKEAGAASATKILTEGTHEYAAAMQKLDRSIATVYSNQQKWTAAQKGRGAADYKTYGEQAAALEELRAEMEAGGLAVDEFNQRYDAIALTMSRAASNIKMYGEAVRAASNDTKTMVEGTSEYNNALEKIDTLLNQITKNTRAWSAAREGEAAESFKNYEAQFQKLIDLKKQLQSGTLSKDDYLTQIGRIVDTMKTEEGTIAAMGKNTSGVFDGIGASLKRFAQYFGMSRVIMAAVQKMKEMVRASIEVESAMNRIQIVTGASDSQMSAFFERATAQSKELGQSITDVAQSLETFSRLGLIV